MHLVKPHLGLIWSGSTSSDDFRPESWARQICSVTDSATSANALVPLTHSPLACQPRIHLPLTQLSSTCDLQRLASNLHRQLRCGRLSPVGFHRSAFTAGGCPTYPVNPLRWNPFRHALHTTGTQVTSRQQTQAAFRSRRQTFTAEHSSTLAL